MALTSPETVRALLVAQAGAEAISSSARVAAAADQLWTRLAQRFGMLLGDAGIRAVQTRSLAIAVGRVPWLATAAVTGEALRTALAAQTTADALAGFAELIASLVALLGRFIGPALVRRVLHDLWPSVLERDEKETV